MNVRIAVITSACHLLSQEEPVSLATLAAQAGLSVSQFQRLFKDTTGVTPKQYQQAVRAQRVRNALSNDPAHDEGHHGNNSDNPISVTDAILDAGYGSNSRFYEKAATLLGMTPRRYRARGQALTIHFGIGQCSLGAILVARTEIGLCAILLGDDPDALLQDLQHRFARANLVGANPEFEQWMAVVIGFVDDPAQGLALPLDIRGTAFQQRVWQALSRIPPGTTISYTELAQRIGIPRAVRAVAQACGANPLAVAIPCHRVVRHDGALAGYRWGIERKRQLLQRENLHSAA